MQRAEFGILGPVVVRTNDGEVAVGGARSRSILAALLLEADRVVSVEQLVDAAWGEDPPASARTQVQNRVSSLRRVLRQANCGVDAIATRGAGYVLRLDDGQLDLQRFGGGLAQAEALVADGRIGKASEALRDALALWRGPALHGLTTTPYLRAASDRLTERHLSALERRIQLDLDLGRHAHLIPELTGLAATHPYSEGLHALLMLALYRAGRQAEALDAFHRARLLLTEQFGVEPGPLLRRMQEVVLRGVDGPTFVSRPAAPEPAAPQPAAPVPRELPADVAGFIGRTGQLDTLDTLIPKTTDLSTSLAIAAIVGTAGVGKTALAVHWAHRVADRFPDGQLHVNLRGYAQSRPVRPIEALGLLLRSLGARPEEVPVDVEEAAALYRSLLAGRRVLVLLDNARSAEQVRPLLPGSKGSLVLVTSRNRLGGLVAREGACRLTLGVLTPDEARTLLARVLDDGRVRAEPDAVAELAKACTYLPLALRITAANLNDHPHRSIADHAARLRNGNPLTALSIDEEAVRAAFDLSYDAVPADAQRLFRLLGLVPGADFTAGAAAALIGTTTDETAPLLDLLAGAHLLEECGPDRFTFHDLLRHYARERVEVDGGERTAAMHRLFDWYLHAADAAARLLYCHVVRLPLPSVDTPQAVPTFAGRVEALDWLDNEHHNLIAAIHHASQHGPPAMAWLLTDSLRAYLSRRGHLVDWLATARAALAAAQAADEPNGQAAMLHSLGQASHYLCRHEEAVEHLTHAMRLSLRGGWWQGHAAAIGNLGIVKQQMGRLEEAVDDHLRALELDRRHERKQGQATVLNNLGNDYLLMGRLPQAVDSLTEALDLYRELGDMPTGESSTLDSLGTAYHNLGRFDEALELSMRALALHQEIGNRYDEVAVLTNLASIYADLGRHQEALTLVETSLALTREIRQRRTEVDGLNTLAAIRDTLGEHEEAIRCYEQALSTVDAADGPYPWIVAMTGLAAAHGRLGHHEIALDHARRALDLAGHCGYRILEGRAMTTLAQIHFAAGQREKALACAHRALDNHRQTGHRLGEARSLVVLAQTSNDAGPHWRAAQDLFAELGVPAPDELREPLPQ